MTVYESIIQLLDNHNIKYRALSHEPTPTCEDSARVRGTSSDQGAKALVCYADKQPIMIVLPCSRKLDPKLFKSLFGVKDLRFATPDEVIQLTSLSVGAIPPLGHLFGLPTYVDAELAKNQTIAFNAGDRTKSVIMAYSDYVPLSQNHNSSHTFSQPK
ncbi:MAG: YbaK/prolyl-tRNA synthetase associated region [Candidatus Amesbacteria bacterium GW2011_GWA2_47_11b]|uniref:YbaK/prolyl-tRNA synthetase associated region n=3 Tax=Candidatus Amesiibacteriota TaxID=1752730 RepID=A0A0G1SHJ7_9BACT|nr:MAG: YbaK/prolyl-tRNA synthetase associated region [Microgenomates group bacterium GW2011_GWC1_46_20]KKU58279.1 MAG: YbaK/prolyl-tRNA synthetase associated region [Candidatus Amesbacteria bacterium GW2011_GWA2_47_11b]KKU68917.1 MAG: YbaK/prolyl-tRNA synthetase associated region [Candidatus Amesbacteria bacterium GW2011_GWA1_47_20]KKU83586.1 MAG: YbaK/prolyl-tRNA synthetase associated region [Candidatus Amesbacteria bacterium GW2011_GWC2_47_8]